MNASNLVNDPEFIDCNNTKILLVQIQNNDITCNTKNYEIQNYL